ncbi:MAG: ribonuclease D, partial [Pseudomonadota bacterium]
MTVEYTLIDEQARLETLCADLADAPYVTVDTEFMRERTYWPQLCLVQIARPAEGGDAGAALIDPMADLDLGPLFELMAKPDVVKVFHAARQDVEIFVKLGDAVPTPIFDTQIAAMVCGYGDQVGYETLVRKVAGAALDKSSRFTDWARRPLTEKQLRYAAGDVTHLRSIYENLASELQRTGRTSWVESEMDALRAKETYLVEPEDAWRRIKTRSNDRKFLGAVRALAKWREEEAQSRDVPRGRILKDDAILEIAANRPETREQLLATRSLQREGRKADTCEAILAALQEGLAQPVAAPAAPPPRRQKPGGQALAELLKVL